MRFMNWLRSLRKPKPVVQPPVLFKGVDLTPDRRVAIQASTPDPTESYRAARRPSQAQADQMRREALADQERRKGFVEQRRDREHTERARQLIHEAEQRSRARGNPLMRRSSVVDTQRQMSEDDSLGLVAGLALISSLSTADTCAAPRPTPFQSGGGGDFGGAGAGGSWEAPAPSPSYDSSSSDSSSSSSGYDGGSSCSSSGD